MVLRRFASSFLCLTALGLAGTAHAQASRTWVSGVGDDANPCSRTAPCKTFAGAISKTSSGGEINVLDPGGFGGVTITKAISIIADHVEAGVLVAGTNAIVINAPATDQVVLRGLDIEGLGTGIHGINFLAGGSLVVENCTINAFAQKGISFTPSGNANLTVRNTTITRNNNASNGGGIRVAPGGSAIAFATLEQVTLAGNRIGVEVNDGGHVSLGNSTVTTGVTGILASASVFAEIDVVDSRVLANSANGVRVTGNATARLSDVYITNNGTGLSAATGGTIVTYGNVQNSGNSSNGAPTQAAIPMQ